MEAFDRLVRTGQTNIRHVRAIATNADADTRQLGCDPRAWEGPWGWSEGCADFLLEDEQPAIRAAATQALGDLGDRATIHSIEQLLDPAVIVGPVPPWGRWGRGCRVRPCDAIQARDNYYRGSSLWVRAHFVAALGQIGSRDVYRPPPGLDDGDPAVQRAAVVAMEQVAGFSYAEGRDSEQQRAAGRRWGQAQLR